MLRDGRKVVVAEEDGELGLSEGGVPMHGSASGDSASSQPAAASARVGVQLHEPVVRELGGGA